MGASVPDGNGAVQEAGLTLCPRWSWRAAILLSPMGRPSLLRQEMKALSITYSP